MNNYNKDFLKSENTQELWDKNKKQFSFFIWGTIATFIFLIVFALVNVGLLLFFRDTIVTKQNSLGDKAGVQDTFQWPFGFWLVVSVLSIISLVSFLISFIKSKQQKNYSTLNTLATYFISLTTFALFVFSFNFLFRINENFVFHEKLLYGIKISGAVILIILWFAFVRFIKLIKAAFIRAAQIEQFKKMASDPNSFLKEIFGNTGLFNNINSETENSNNDSSEDNSKQKDDKSSKENDSSERKEKFDKLVNLPNEKLFRAAKQLYISGYESMTKEELANKILDTIEQEKKRKEFKEQQKEQEDSNVTDANSKEDSTKVSKNPLNDDNKKQNKDKKEDDKK
ncbi:hypothetical protein [Mycoplasma sp. Mirounga ES2805-ORL]|uniref:hypothetical protein n=1 Tax=Mycoplasma sp. Mirounga ES2805-ORL TaxID=754514 RepID=UPI00197B625C|nr:hypothetical protein [Mycoplasma sp. Mirounga ES2805-ORL]QSF13416.1 hypothetical protein JXZ90_01935 [Mycoplasma sp. Mirounga ES2805-ORL]